MTMTSKDWIVQFKCGYEACEFITWTNSDGEVAVFEKAIAVQFAQGMVLAYDSVKQWAIFRVRPYEGHDGEQYFFTLIQPDGKYTAAVSAFGEQRRQFAIHLAGFNDDGFPTLYTYNDVGALFLRRMIDNWRVEYVYDGVTGYSNPNRPKFSNGDILKLPTGLMRPVEFITPHWIAPGQVGFRYWFYVCNKQLVDYAQDKLEPVMDVETFELEVEPRPQRKMILEVKEVPALATFASADLAEPTPDIQCVLDKMQKDMDFKDHTIERLKNVLNDIERCTRNQSTDVDDLWGWLGYMATMGLQGGKYGDWIPAKFGVGEAPKQDYTLVIHFNTDKT